MTTTMPESPKNLMCYPTDYNGFLVTFDTNENEKIDMISYYLATDNPYQWISPSPVHNKNKNGVENSVNITMDSISNIVPFKPYMLYLRGIRMTSTSDDSVLITKMSPGVQCATQGRK